MTWNKACCVVILSAVLAGCNPGIYRMWTVEKGDLIDQDHIQPGERFAVAKTSDGAVIRPKGTLASRWGFSERPLTKVGNIYCVEVDLGPDHVVDEEKELPHSLHWFTFIYPWLGNAKKVRVEYFAQQGVNHPCNSPSEHKGVVHAED